MKKTIIFLFLFSFSISVNAQLIYTKGQKTLLVNAKHNTIIRINPYTGKSISSISFWNPIYNFKYTSNNRYIIVSSKNEIYLLSPDSLRSYKTFRDLDIGSIFDSDLTPDQKYVIATVQNNNQIIIINTATKEIVKQIHVQYTPSNIIMAPSNKFAYITTENDKYLIQLNWSTFDYKYIKKYY